MVATPLGNLEDLSPRAVRMLQEVDLIACEDTRHTRKLLTHLGLDTPATSYHEHNEETEAPRLLEKLRQGQDLALVSDAGTPLLSDPGYRLVHLCREEGVNVVPVPGASAAIAALSVSGLASDRFLFLGFLSRQNSALREQLKQVVSIDATLIFYVSPHRLAATLEAAADALGERRAFLIREMTKMYETSYYGRLEEIASQVREESSRGEYTLVVQGAPGGAQEAAPAQIDVVAYVEGLVQARGLSKKEAIKLAAQQLGMPKREVYRIVSEGAAR